MMIAAIDNKTVGHGVGSGISNGCSENGGSGDTCGGDSATDRNSGESGAVSPYQTRRVGASEYSRTGY